MEVVTINPLDDPRTPLLLRDSMADYDWMVRNIPEIYRHGFKASDTGFTTRVLEQALSLALFDIMRDLLDKHQPDAIVATYPIYQAPLNAIFTLYQYYIPIITTITDLASVHRIWFSAGAELCLAPTAEVQALALKHGIAQNKIRVTGIPVSPIFARKDLPKRALREKLGWRTDLPTFLAVGSRRVEKLVEMLHVLNHFGSPLQVVAVAGNDEALYQQLKAVNWHVPSHIYNFVENMPELMKAADVMICKAGGLIVTESLASGLPIMLIDVIPGQEEGNLEYVLKNEAGVFIETPLQMLETLAHWMSDGKAGLKAIAKNARHIGKPNAALDAAELVWRAALRGPQNERKHLGISRESLIDLFKLNQIAWRDALLPAKIAAKLKKPENPSV